MDVVVAVLLVAWFGMLLVRYLVMLDVMPVVVPGMAVNPRTFVKPGVMVGPVVHASASVDIAIRFAAAQPEDRGEEAATEENLLDRFHG
jgi:hypothetical protein